MTTPDSAASLTDRLAALRAEQPLPVGNGEPIIHRLVQEDLESRLVVGIATYGQPLQPFNGRDPLRDAYEECLDQACYLKQAIIERQAREAELAALRERLAQFGDVINVPLDPPDDEPAPHVTVS